MNERVLASEMEHIGPLVFERLGVEDLRHLLRHEEKDLQVVVAQPIDSIDIFTTSQCEHQVAAMGSLADPEPGLVFAIDGVGEDGEPCEIVLEEPFHGIDIAPYGIGESSQFGIAVVEQPTEEVLAAGDALQQR